MERYAKNTRGFTLIELSIVLVILGLIVGGIVGGNSLIESAKLQSVIREMNSYTTAYNAFKLQYDAIPGDMKDAWNYFGGGIDSVSAPAPCGENSESIMSGCNGNGNGLIGALQQDAPNSEGTRAFLHMQLADIIPGKVGAYQTSRFAMPSPGTSHAGANFHYNLPSLEGGSSFDGWMLTSHGYPSAVSTTNWFGKSGNWLQAGAFAGNSHYLLDGATFTQRQASTIDKKIDDGKPVTGNVSAITGGDHTDPGNTASLPCMTGGYGDNGVTYEERHTVAQDYPDLTYNVAGNNIACVLHFYVGS